MTADVVSITQLLLAQDTPMLGNSYPPCRCRPRMQNRNASPQGRCNPVSRAARFDRSSAKEGIVQNGCLRRALLIACYRAPKEGVQARTHRLHRSTCKHDVKAALGMPGGHHLT